MNTAIVTPEASVHSPIDLTSINTIRTLAMDGVQAANSGHPGTPMPMAPVRKIRLSGTELGPEE
jgi:transketolase